MNQFDATSFAIAASEDAEEPPSSSRRHPHWKDVPRSQWEDWRWQMQNAVRTTSQLVELLPHPPRDIAALESLESQYKLAIPPYYFSLIDVDDPQDPIRLQSCPSTLEMTSETGLELEDPSKRIKIRPCRASRTAIQTAC